jgi:hypothetical protein
VTVLALEDDETFELTAELELELTQSLAEAARGETVGADEVLRRLRKTR